MTRQLSDMLLLLAGLSPPVLLLFVPLLYPPSCKPLIAWCSIALGLAIGAAIIAFLVHKAVETCGGGTPFKDDCYFAAGIARLYAFYFGLFALFGIIRIVFDFKKARTITLKG